jgi:hypothetical protein
MNGDWQEFILPYEEVRSAANPERMLLAASSSLPTMPAADLADWDRVKLEREPVAP